MKYGKRKEVNILKRMKIRKSVFSIALSGIIVIALTLMILLPRVGTTMADSFFIEANTTILYFEQSGLVYEEWVEIGTKWEDLGLPIELQAVLEIRNEKDEYEGYEEIETGNLEIWDSEFGIRNEEDFDEGSGPRTQESGDEGDEDSGLMGQDSGDEGNEDSGDLEIREIEIQEVENPEAEIQETEIQETEIQETEIQEIEIQETEIQEIEIFETEVPKTELIELHEFESIETTSYKPASIQTMNYEIATGTSLFEPEESEDSGIRDQGSGETEDSGDRGQDSGDEVYEESETSVMSVPVTWEGYYDGDEPGEYILTALIEGYNYSGEMPIAIITVFDPQTPMRGPQRGPGGATADYVIDIGKGKQGLAPYPGYALAAGSRKVDFDAAANGIIYEVIQTANTEGFWTFNIHDGISLTIILNDIGKTHNIPDIYVHMYGSADLNLLLRGENTIKQGYFIVRENTTLTIDSADIPGSTHGSLSISSNDANHAVIGGFYSHSSGSGTTKNDSGLITINGGTITATAVDNSNPGYNAGAVIGGGNTTNGTVVINGGSVTAIASDVSQGAAIGGGSYATGNVEIHGGTVHASIPVGGNHGTGAAIGGGQGSGNDVTGRGNVTITGGHVTATSRGGAAIGGGRRSANATILITGGTIVATSNHSTGAAIGGGGGSTGGSDHSIGGEVDVTINGGDLTLTSWIGAGVGNGGYETASTPTHAETIRGSVAITGGRIYVDVNEGNGVGTGLNNKVVPNLFIDDTADIIVFGRIRTAFAGIYAGDNVANHKYGLNQGSGFYVNINFPDPSNTTNPTLLDRSPIKAGTRIIITANGSVADPFLMLTTPNNIGMLSFTTGSTSSQNFYVYVETSGGFKEFAHPSSPRPDTPQTNPALIIYNDTRVYSVNATHDYYDNGHVHDNYFRSLPLKANSGGSAYHTVIEKYVDKTGDPIGLDDSFVMVEDGNTYSKSVLPTVSGYSYKGYIWEIKPTGNNSFAGKHPLDEVITEDRLIYFVYDVKKIVVPPTGIIDETWAVTALAITAIGLLFSGLAAVRYIRNKFGVRS